MRIKNKGRTKQTLTKMKMNIKIKMTNAVSFAALNFRIQPSIAV